MKNMVRQIAVTLCLLGGTFAASTGAATAAVIFDFVCDDPTCGGDPIWGGSYEFTDASVLSGVATGAADILSFSFQSSDKGGLSWVLADLSNGHTLAALTVTFNGARDRILSINGGSSVCGSTSAPCAGYNNDASGDGIDFLGTNAFEVDDNLNQTLSGDWVRRLIPEPGTLALFGLGLVGLGVARRRKAA